MSRPVRPPGPAERRGEPMVAAISADGATRAATARDVAHRAPGVLHLAVSVQVVDLSRKSWLLQRRAATKALFGGHWANTCCTHPAPGEDPATVALRRVREELGLTIEHLVPAGAFTYRATDGRSGLVEHEHDHVFLGFADAGELDPDPDEIGEIALLPFAEALEMVGTDMGAPWATQVLRHSHAALDRQERAG